MTDKLTVYFKVPVREYNEHKSITHYFGLRKMNIDFAAIPYPGSYVLLPSWYNDKHLQARSIEKVIFDPWGGLHLVFSTIDTNEQEFEETKQLFVEHGYDEIPD